MTRTFNKKTNSIKFLYSYGGKILPRITDGQLRYVGGFTRIIAFDRFMTFSEMMVKFGELCGSSMSLRCKLPSEDLDVLVSITSDDDLANVIEEYDRVSPSEMKIRAVLFPIKTLKTISPPSSVSSNSSASPCRLYSLPQQYRCGYRSSSPVVGFPVDFRKDGGAVRRDYYRCYDCERERSKHICLVPQRNYIH